MWVASLRLSTSASASSTIWHLLLFSLAMEKLYYEAHLSSRVASSIYGFFDDLDGRGKFFNSSNQLQWMQIKEI